MNRKIRQRLWTFASLIAIFSITTCIRQTAVEIVQDEIVENNVDKTQQYKLAKLQYRLLDFFSLRKIYSHDLKAARKNQGIHGLGVVRAGGWNIDRQIRKSIYKRGYANKKGKMVIPAVFDAARKFTGDYAVVKFKGEYGIIDKQGRAVTPFKYDYIYSHAVLAEGGYIAAKIDGKEGRTNLDGDIIVPFVYDAVESYSINRDYVIATKSDRQGVTDLDGKTIVPFEYDEVIKHRENATIVEQKEDIGVVNRQNEYVSLIDPSKSSDFLEAELNDDLFIENVAMLRFQDGDTERYCVVSRQGEILVSSQSTRHMKQHKIDNLCYSLAGIKVDNNRHKPTNYPANSPESEEKPYEHLFTDGLLQVHINGQVRYVNLAGELVTWANKFDQLGKFSEGLAAFVEDGRYGYVDRQGNIAFYLEEDMVAANYTSQTNNHHYTDTTDWIFFPEQFSNFKNGLAEITHMDEKSQTVRQDCPAYEESPLGKGYIDKTGKIVKYEPIVPPSTVYSEVGGSEGNYHYVNCDLRF